MIARLFAAGFLLLGATNITLAAESTCTPKEFERIEKIARIFMERPTSYSFMVESEKGVYTLQSAYADYGPTVTFFTDVPKDKPLWVRKLACTTDPDKWYSRQYKYLEIHLHQVQDVEGGGWSAGKSGSGMTTPIQ